MRNCIFSGNKPYGIHNGIDGLINDEVRPIEWSDVTGWVVEVTSFLTFHVKMLFVSGRITVGNQAYSNKCKF